MKGVKAMKAPKSMKAMKGMKAKAPKSMKAMKGMKAIVACARTAINYCAFIQHFGQFVLTEDVFPIVAELKAIEYLALRGKVEGHVPMQVVNSNTLRKRWGQEATVRRLLAA